ncbi:MAG: trehalase family glycosidase [Terracidiphilus sp.]
MSRSLLVVLASCISAALWCGCSLGKASTAFAQQTGSGDDAASAAARWLSENSQHLSPAQAELLQRAQTTLLGNVVSLPAWKPYRGVEPSLINYKGIWNWDSAFHAMAISEWDSALAREQFDILFSHQLASGALPDVVWAKGGMVTTITKPPVMAWAIAVVDHRSPDTEYLRKMYPKLAHLGEFFLRERGGAADGLFYYAGADTGEDSGWDDSIRWDDGYRKSKSNEHRLWAIDLNCYMVMHYRAMAYIAGRLGLSQDEDAWKKAAAELASRINEKLWDDKLGFYVDRDRVTGKNGPALSPAGFMPLFVRIASPERAARMEKLAADPEKFFPGMPTAAYDTPGFQSHGYWRGSTWLNTSYFALKGLDQYGYTETAEAMRSQLLGHVARDRSTIWEYYDSKDGAGAGAKGLGWSAAFTIAFLLDWNNDNLTWLF